MGTTERALEAALTAARRVGLPVDEPIVLRDLTNVIVQLRPSPVVARVPVLFGALRGREAVEAELRAARFLVGAGAPVAGPATEVDCGPHEVGGTLVTFWRYLEHERYGSDTRAVGRALRRFHGAFAPYPERLVPCARLEELRRVAAELEPSAHATLDELRELRDFVDRLQPLPEGQPLHGDAHFGNVLWTQAGPVWCDLENVCRGPVEYDLAAIVYRRAQGTDEAIVAYGSHDPELLAEALRLVTAQLAVWTLVLAQTGRLTENPEPRGRLERALAARRG